MRRVGTFCWSLVDEDEMEYSLPPRKPDEDEEVGE